MTGPDKSAELTEKAINRLREVYDPEIPVNIYDLGLIYKIEPLLGEEGKPRLLVEMTLTTPSCPMAGAIPGMVHDSLAKIEEIGDIEVRLVWNPPWEPSRMSDEARLALDMF